MGISSFDSLAIFGRLTEAACPWPLHASSQPFKCTLCPGDFGDDAPSLPSTREPMDMKLAGSMPSSTFVASESSEPALRLPAPTLSLRLRAVLPGRGVCDGRTIALSSSRTDVRESSSVTRSCRRRARCSSVDARAARARRAVKRAVPVSAARASVRCRSSTSSGSTASAVVGRLCNASKRLRVMAGVVPGERAAVGLAGGDMREARVDSEVFEGDALIVRSDAVDSGRTWSTPNATWNCGRAICSAVSLANEATFSPRTKVKCEAESHPRWFLISLTVLFTSQSKNASSTSMLRPRSAAR